MAVFVYSACAADGDGALMRGTVAADSPRQARDRLREQGLLIQNLDEQPAAPQQGLWSRYLQRRQAGNVTGFLQELATLLGAGVPLLEALDTITRQHTGRFQRTIMLVRDHIASGGSLAEAMAQQPILFDELCRNIVEVGENAGTLDTALASLVEFRRRSAGQTNKVLSALIYPAIVLCVAVCVSTFLMTYVVPRLLQALLESGKPLPLATVIVKGASDLLLGWWWAILLAIILLVGAVSAILRSDRGSRAWHRLQLRLPLLGDLIRKQAIARMAIVMATLLKSDVVFLRAIRIAQRTVHNRVLRNALIACEQAVMSGRDISDALEKTQAFPPLVIQMFAVGQASGRLESMLESLAVDYDTQVDITAGRVTTLLEPVMMIFLAIVVGFIAFATILPILEAGNVL
jgi:general secretion pathway protein F